MVITSLKIKSNQKYTETKKFKVAISLEFQITNQITSKSKTSLEDLLGLVL